MAICAGCTSAPTGSAGWGSERRIGRCIHWGAPPLWARPSGCSSLARRGFELAAGGWRADRARGGQASFDLGPAISPRDVLWPRGRLVIVEDRRIRTYVLP